MAHPPHEIPWAAVARYVAGEMADHERELFERWLEADADRRVLVEHLREVWSVTGRLSPTWDDPEAVLAAIKRTPPARSVPIWAALRIAAAVALLVGGALLWRRSAAFHAASPGAPVGMRDIRTARGERLALRLADGTAVTLAPGSVLRTPSTYGAGPRTVYLQGAAYFEVAHDAAHPFIVETPRAVAHDLGTRFVVRAYATDARTEVAVAEGRVAIARRHVSSAADSLVLQPGELGRLSADDRLTRTRNATPDRYFGWTAGRLVFDDTPLREVLDELARWRDVEVRLSDPSLGGRHVTASFTREPIGDILRLVAGSVGLRAEREGSGFVVRAP